MARFKAQDVDNYGGQGGAGYFSLKGDKDVARVRFMYNGIEDVEGMAVHQVEINGKKRWVNCLREYNEPVSKCPFCEAGMYQNAKLFIPLYNIDEDKVQIWERGKKFFAKISSICSRYKDLVSHEFEIERNGKPGDQQTTYEVYEVNDDDTTLEDLPELPEIMGSVVLDKSATDMNYYLEHNKFPDENDEEEIPRRESRRSRREQVEEEEELPFEEEVPSRNSRTSGRSQRRTPASSRGRRTETF